MYLHWNQNGRERVWDLSENNINRKLRKAVRIALNKLAKQVSDGTIVSAGIVDAYSKLCEAKNVADIHFAIYGLIGGNEFQSFEIRSTK